MAALCWPVTGYVFALRIWPAYSVFLILSSCLQAHPGRDGTGLTEAWLMETSLGCCASMLLACLKLCPAHMPAVIAGVLPSTALPQIQGMTQAFSGACADCDDPAPAFQPPLQCRGLGLPAGCGAGQHCGMGCRQCWGQHHL
eukprot:1160573-Pelagomonas_calceolata.AAC.27